MADPDRALWFLVTIANLPYNRLQRTVMPDLTRNKMTQRTRFHLLIASALLLLVACGPLQLDLEATATAQIVTSEAMTRTAEPSRTPEAADGLDTATIWCTECEEENTGLDLFSEPRSGSEVAGSLRHGTEVTILKYENVTYLTWARVRGDGVEGWVLQQFLKW